jgi:hypothetical protein
MCTLLRQTNGSGAGRARYCTPRRATAPFLFGHGREHPSHFGLAMTPWSRRLAGRQPAGAIVATGSARGSHAWGLHARGLHARGLQTSRRSMSTVSLAASAPIRRSRPWPAGAVYADRQGQTGKILPWRLPRRTGPGTSQWSKRLSRHDLIEDVACNGSMLATCRDTEAALRRSAPTPRQIPTPGR